MMETMIPPEVRMRLRTKNKIKKKEAKEAQIKKEEKRGHKKEKGPNKKIKK